MSRLRIVVALVAALTAVGVLPAVAAPAPPPGLFVPLQAARLFDSRDATKVVDSGFARAPGPLGPGQVVGVPVAGRGGVPDTGAGTVVLNVTGTMLFSSSFLTVWPQGAPRPPTSTLSLAPGRPVTTTVVTKLGDGGAVSLANVSGLSDATVDVVGWFPERSPLVSGVPARLLDTRAGPGALGPGEVRTLRVDGPGFAPAPPGTAVLLTLTAASATEPTAITAWATGGPRPLTPTLTVAPQETLPNTTMVPVGADGTISLANASGFADVLADLVAVVPPIVGAATGPERVYDSRTAGGAVAPGQVRTVAVLGRAGVPPTGVSSVLVNATGIEPAANGAVGVWGAGPPPTTSAVVVPAGRTRPGFAVVPVSPEGTIRVAAAGSAMDVTLDVVGWFGGTPAAAGPAAAPGVPAPAPDGGRVLWSADFASGLSQFRSTPWNLVGGAVAAVGGDRPGVAFSMPGGGQRAEIEPNFRSLREGDDLWFGQSVTLADGFPIDTSGWQVITQWKNDGTGSPPLSIKVGNGQFLLDGGFGGGAPFQVPIGPATTGRPHTLVTHVVFSGGGGSVDVWLDGRQTIGGLRPPAGTLYGGSNSYVKTGIYRDTAISQPGTLFFGDWRIGTSYAAAYPR